jgi:hypothetical protein
MAIADGKSAEGQGSKLYRQQLITIEDLETFKTDLLQEIKSLINHQAGGQVKQWLRSVEVRKMLGISPGTLQNFRVNGTLSFTRIGGIIFYKYEDILKVLEGHGR